MREIGRRLARLEVVRQTSFVVHVAPADPIPEGARFVVIAPHEPETMEEWLRDAPAGARQG